MMARSTTRSNQRPDTLMQDRTPANSRKSSCNARPDHTCGSKATQSVRLSVRSISALPPIATGLMRPSEASLSANRDPTHCSKGQLLDHFVRELDELVGNRQAERLGG